MKKVLVFGGSGLVGSKFIDLNKNIFEIKSPSTTEVDILNKDSVSQITQEFIPDTVINFAAFTQVEEAEKDKGNKEGICYLLNAVGAKNIAEVCKQFNTRLIHISTEYVFDGNKSEAPYTEDDKPNPINWYGQTKYCGEQFVLESGSQSVIARLSMPFSAYYELKKDIARFFLKELHHGKEINAVEDQKITPVLVDDVANALVVLINNQVSGIYNICVTNFTTPFKFARLIAQKFNLDIFLIKPISFKKYNKGKLVKLLKNSWLDPTKFRKDFGDQILHTVEEGLIIFKTEIDQLK